MFIGKPIVHVAVPPLPVVSPVVLLIAMVGADVNPVPLPPTAIEAIDLPQKICNVA